MFELPVSCSALLLCGAVVAQSPVVINEVYYDAPGGDNGQVFVELYGPPSTDISGWTIQAIEGRGSNASNCNNESFTFPAGTLIGASGFVVVADDDGTGATQVANANFIVPDMDLENGGDAVQLIDNNGRVVDAVAYGAVDKATAPAASLCNGGIWYEGNEARDVFAPLSIERCPAGADTNDNYTDFKGTLPTPGTGQACCKAIEWVDQGVGNSLTTSNGDSVGFDFWFAPCGANQAYLVVASFTDPAMVPPPPPFPVLDGATAALAAAANTPPFVAWFGNLDAQGESIGAAALDFSAVPIPLGMSVPMYIGAIAFDQSNTIVGTNSVMVTLQ